MENQGKSLGEAGTGGITRCIMKLHGFDQEVTNSMFGSWKEGRVRVNGVSFLKSMGPQYDLMRR